VKRKLTWVNRVGLVLYLSSFIVLVILAAKLTVAGPTTDVDTLFGRAFIFGILAVVGFEMWLHIKKPPSSESRPKE
jgi:hypothetical protein